MFRRRVVRLTPLHGEVPCPPLPGVVRYQHPHSQRRLRTLRAQQGPARGRRAIGQGSHNSCAESRFGAWPRRNGRGRAVRDGALQGHKDSRGLRVSARPLRYGTAAGPVNLARLFVRFVETASRPASTPNTPSSSTWPSPWPKTAAAAGSTVADPWSTTMKRAAILARRRRGEPIRTLAGTEAA